MQSHDDPNDERANLILAEDAITGLTEALSGQYAADDELDEALGVTPEVP